MSIKYVLDESRTVCLKRFTREPFKPSGWKNLNRRTNRSTPSQLACLRRLWNWRDATARDLDESVGYVCPNSAIARIASVLPSSTAALQRLINPLPLPVLHSSQEILDIINESLEEGRLERISSIQHNIPKTPKRANESEADMVLTNRSKVLSPVLGTEALYKQAGWTSPIVGVHAAFVEDSEADSNFSDEEGYSLRQTSHKGNQNSLLSLNVANEEYNTDKYMDHSLELDAISRADGRSITVDGLGAARAVLDLTSDTKRSIEDEVAAAERAASNVRADIEKRGNMLSITHNMNLTAFDPVADLIGDVTTKVCDSDKKEDPGEMLEELGMPKSMREMYHNYMNSSKKRKQKKNPSESNADEMDVDTLEGAQDHLRKKGYYDKGGIFHSREKSTGGDAGQEANLKLVQEVGWISNDEAAKKLIESKAQDKTSSLSKSGKKKESKDNSNNSRGKPKSNDKTKPFDYSNTHSVGLVSGSGALPSENPFFSGAALKLESVSTKTKNPDRKKKNKQNNTRSNNRSKGKQRFEERPQGGGNRTHVYRN